MTVKKNDFPVLEFDTDEQAVIMPNHEGFNMKLPRKAVIGFLYNSIDRYAKNMDCKEVGRFITCAKSTSIYETQLKGESVCFCQAPVGAASAAALMDWLISYGVTQIIATGSCGVLLNLPENQILVPVKVLRDEGTSYKYMPASRYAYTSPEATDAIEMVLQRERIPYEKVFTWTTDGFFRETKEMTQYRIQEGCQVVEMECAALCAVAKMRGISFGQILYSGDTLADPDCYNSRNFGMESGDIAFNLALKAVLEMEEM